MLSMEKLKHLYGLIAHNLLGNFKLLFNINKSFYLGVDDEVLDIPDAPEKPQKKKKKKKKREGTETPTDQWRPLTENFGSPISG